MSPVLFHSDARAPLATLEGGRDRVRAREGELGFVSPSSLPPFPPITRQSPETDGIAPGLSLAFEASDKIHNETIPEIIPREFVSRC